MESHGMKPKPSPLSEACRLHLPPASPSRPVFVTYFDSAVYRGFFATRNGTGTYAIMRPRKKSKKAATSCHQLPFFPTFSA
jgi:hypothetical protein